MKYKPSQFLLKGSVGSLAFDTCSLEEAWTCYAQGRFGLLMVDVSNDTDLYRLYKLRESYKKEKGK